MKAEAPDLRVRTRAFALRVIKLYFALPKTEAARVVGKPVLRSGAFVGANYREAQRSRSRAECIAKIGDCLEELDDSANWLELLADSGIVATAKLAARRDKCDPLLAIFTTVAKQAKTNPA